MKKILVIDDDPEIVHLIGSRLTASQYKVITASDGKDAALKVEVEKPDMILVDIKMPKMDGWTFVRNIRRGEETRNTPIIVITAYANMRDIFEVEGTIDYIVKPFRAEDLLEKIKQYEAKAGQRL